MATEIEQIKEEVQRNIKQATNLEENTFMTQLLKQDRDYYTKLDDLMTFYPTYKTKNTASNQTTYGSKLASVNGITKNIQNITTSIQENVSLFNASLEATNRDIERLKTMYDNLLNYSGDDSELDLTSKRLLKDYVNIYSTQRIMIWIKGIILLYLVIRLISAAVTYKEIWIYVFGWIVGIILLLLLNYLYYRWQTTVSLPEGATTNSVNGSATPLTCQQTEFGCCPDGVTVSVKNKLNCGCMDSDYGCCPDGTNKNKDGSCKPYDPNPLPCNQTDYGCCPDEKTISNETGTNCNTSDRSRPPLCSRTQYGCCPDGNSISNKDRSNCPGSCAFSQYGCCPNGVTISNKDRSNCEVPICTSTKYGCCPNGNTRNKTGTNC